MSREMRDAVPFEISSEDLSGVARLPVVFLTLWGSFAALDLLNSAMSRAMREEGFFCGVSTVNLGGVAKLARSLATLDCPSPSTLRLKGSMFGD
ncbi:hypothetical protein BJX62DRAFT_215209 [Aspergillus germanicus]